MNPEEQKNLVRNYIVNVLDGAFFGFGIGFASFSTVIPLFVSRMTDSAILIGLISAVHVMGWQVPQLLTASSVSRMRRYKPTVMWMTIHERIPFLGLAAIAWAYPLLGPVPAVGLTFLMLIWQGFGAGFTANAWQNMISKVIPGESLATFFGLQSSAANLLASLAAVWSGMILERQAFPDGYVMSFLLCFGMLIISFIAVSLTRESPHEHLVAVEAQPPILHSIRAILARDTNFRWFLLARVMILFGVMAFSFYTVYAATRLNAGEYVVGIITSILFITQVIANPLLGWIADRWSRKGVLEIGAVCIVASALLARFAPTVAWLYPAVVMAGIASTASWTITMAMTLQFGHDHERPTYVGMANTLVAPATVIAPLLGGWLADQQGYSATFLLSAIASILAIVTFHFFVRDPRKPASTP